MVVTPSVAQIRLQMSAVVWLAIIRPPRRHKRP
jgi:threonine/homoserine efflux transporter RhtA